MGEFRVHHCRFFNYSPSAVHCLAYNQQHQRLAVARADGTIETWNTADAWVQEMAFPTRDGSSVEALVWGGNNRLFSAGLHGELHEHDLATLQTMRSVPSNNGAIWCLCINQAKTQIAAGTEAGCVVIFDISDSGLEFKRSFTKQEGRILCVAWHDAENVIVSGGVDNLRLWSTFSGQAIQRLTLGRQARNAETIVWAVAVTSDFTIVSGDSRGKTSFWHGKQGTLKKAFNSHKADVLSVCVSADGRSVFSSGIDPTLVQFEYMPVNLDDSWSQWVPTNMRHQHTHDVRALATLADSNLVVSGGVDCHIIYNNISPTSHWRRISPVPQISLVNFAPSADILQLQYPEYLELWKLGATDAATDEDGVQLPISRNPIKLLQLKSMGDRSIVTAALSLDASRVAYADNRTVRVHCVNVSACDVPNVHVESMKQPLKRSILPARCLCFSPADRDTLFTCTKDGHLQRLHISKELQIEVTATLTQEGEGSCHLLTVCATGKYVATADHASNVHVYSISTKKTKVLCSLPRRSSAVTALAFHPREPLLAVTYADQTLYEFDVEEEEYSAWSRDFVRRMHPQWKDRRHAITQLLYHPRDTNLLLLRDEACLYIIDKSQELPDPGQKLKKGKHAIHTCTKFKYLMHLNAGADNFLIAVERPPLAITETLPSPFKKKKFGH